MIRFWITGVVSAVGIGAAIALITTGLGGKRLSGAAGLVLVAMLALVYHAVAALGMSVPILHPLVLSIIVPFGVGFGAGNPAFALALIAQATLAATLGMGLYWSMNRKRFRERMTI